MGKEKVRYTFAHLGINPDSATACAETVAQLGRAFGFPSADVGASVIVAGPLEVLKRPGPGGKGHLGIETDQMDAAMEDLMEKGFHFDESTMVRDVGGELQSVYLQEEIAGFAIHLLHKR